MHKKDITTSEDIELLINTFYEKVRANKKIGYIFNDIAKVDWEHHLPVMYSFWSSMLLGSSTYSGNPMVKHIALSKIATLGENEFDEWLRLFSETLNDLFQGQKADEAKMRANSIAKLMQFKIDQKPIT